ncbi:MAG: ribonuclease PH [Cyanobacteriota bacterium ELA615]|jgi:ribonuclease PH
MARQRIDQRLFNDIRPVRFEKDFTAFSMGSVLTHCDNTKVLCTVSVQNGVPKFLAGKGTGWLTAEYRMLPGSTPERKEREFMKLSGRTQEIQRLIGRSLRAVLDLEALGERTIIVDADVLQADAGTRTTAINGGYVALALAIKKMLEQGELLKSPLRSPVAAISVGQIAGDLFLDLNYEEDSQAEVDFNVVMTGDLELVEVQGTGESGTFSRKQLDHILDLAQSGIEQILKLQAQAIQ